MKRTVAEITKITLDPDLTERYQVRYGRQLAEVVVDSDGVRHARPAPLCNATARALREAVWEVRRFLAEVGFYDAAWECRNPASLPPLRNPIILPRGGGRYMARNGVPVHVLQDGTVEAAVPPGVSPRAVRAAVRAIQWRIADEV